MTAVLPDRTTGREGVAVALATLRQGDPVLLQHGAGGAEIVIAAERVTTSTMALLVRHSSGLACVALPGERLDALRIPLMAPEDPRRMAFAVSVDLCAGVTTGISARERALTARALADPATQPADLVRPGHVVPVRVHPDGVLERPAPAEAAADLCRLAGLVPAAVLATVAEEAVPSLCELPAVRLEDLVRYRERAEPPVRAGSTVALPTSHGEFQARGYAGTRDGTEHLAMVRGEVGGATPVPVRVHAECLTGDVLGSLGCRCAAELAASLDAIDRAGRGVVVYLRRGHRPWRGPRHASCTTRDYRVASHILLDLGVQAAVLLTDDPEHARGLSDFGITVTGPTAMPDTAPTVSRPRTAPPARPIPAQNR